MTNGPLRVGVVGAGYWGPNLIRTLSRLPACVVAYACERRPGRLRYLAENFPAIQAVPDLERLLDDPTLDAVVIATPVPTHRELAEAALRAGKHVLVEKPLAATSRDAEVLVELAALRGLVLATGHIFVYHPAVVGMRAAIAAGELGNLCYAAAQRMNLGPPDSELNVIWDLAVHDLSILLSLLGRSPCEVITEGLRYVHASLTDVAFITLRYSDGFAALLHVSWRSALKVRRFFLAGTRGSANFDDALEDSKLVLCDIGTDTRIGARDTDVTDLMYGPGQVKRPTLSSVAPLTAECMHFLDCVRTGRKPLVDGWAGLEVVRVLEAAERSFLMDGCPIRVEQIAANVQPPRK